MPIRSQMSSIIGQIKLEHPKIFALEFGKIAECDFSYTLSSTNNLTGRLAQLVEHRTREHSVSGLYRLWVRVPGWPTKKLLIVFRMRG